MTRFFYGLCFAFFMLFGCGNETADISIEANMGHELKNNSAGIGVEIDMKKNYYDTKSDLMVKITYTNKTNENIDILPWAVPSPDFWLDVFDITLDGRRVSYIGRLVYYAEPKKEDFIKLEPGESIVGQVNIDRLYDLSKDGEYNIQVRFNLAAITGNVEYIDDIIQSNPINTYIKGRKKIIKIKRVKRKDGVFMITYGCSRAQRSALKESHLVSKNESRASHLYLKHHENPEESIRYKTWYGEYNVERYDSVESDWKKIKRALSGKHVTEYFCDCTNVIAWVYPHREYEIHICDGFFGWPIKGKNSQSGVIIHEMSHFKVVAGTDDYVYWVKGSKELAKKYPDKAIKNADNFRLFFEDKYIE